MPKDSDVDLVYADLEAALAALEAAAVSPRDIRRTFSRFVELSQRLTSTMRKEYAELTGRKWQASLFQGWNSVTSLFKELRNEEQHERPIFISVHETREYEPFGPGSGRIAFSGTWQLTDQLMTSPPDGMTMFAADEETGAMTDEELPVVARYFGFQIQARSEQLKQAIEAAGSSSVHELSRNCFKTLSEYHAFYRATADA